MKLRRPRMLHWLRYPWNVSAPANDNWLRWGAEPRLGRTFIGETRPWP
jgi:hypothetical protein